jgi:YD repeat-containing protein
VLYEYDPSGTLHKVTDALVADATYGYDDNNRRISQTNDDAKSLVWVLPDRVVAWGPSKALFRGDVTREDMC